MTTFLVVDDHEVVRRGCIALLKNSWENSQVLQAAAGEDAIALVRNKPIDLIILDVRLPGVSGIEAARRIRTFSPHQKILFFSMYEELAVVRRAIDLGGVAYVSKNAAPEEFVDAVTAALRGDFYVQHEIAMRLVNNGKENQPAVLNDLTAREFEIFSMLSQGRTVHEIGNKLNLSSKTISNYASTIRNKLGVNTQAEMVFLAMDAGLIPSPTQVLSPQVP